VIEPKGSGFENFDVAEAEVLNSSRPHRCLVVFACLSPGEWTCGFVMAQLLLDRDKRRSMRSTKALRPSGTRKDETGNVIAAKWPPRKYEV
jgi:hypothetical protein